MEQVAALDQTVALLHADGQLPGLIETVPTFRSLAIIIDPSELRRQLYAG
jgi:allophanate hydrolase subunit 1